MKRFRQLFGVGCVYRRTGMTASACPVNGLRSSPVTAILNCHLTQVVAVPAVFCYSFSAISNANSAEVRSGHYLPWFIHGSCCDQ
jgi:hypothetical protein